MSNPIVRNWSPDGIVLPREKCDDLPSGIRASEAAEATSILQRDRLMRGKSRSYVSKKSGISEARLARLESGHAVAVLPEERSGLKRAGFIDDADLLIKPASSENVGKTKKVI